MVVIKIIMRCSLCPDEGKTHDESHALFSARQRRSRACIVQPLFLVSGGQSMPRVCISAKFRKFQKFLARRERGGLSSPSTPVLALNRSHA